MTAADPDLLRRARMALYADAEAHRGKLSRMGWEERADDSEAGQLVGPREIEAIAELIFGRRRHGSRR